MKGGRGASAAARIAVAAAVAAALLQGPALGGERLCGSVFSAGHPVREAHVAAAELGLVAVTDSTGAFCLEGLEAGAVALRVFALGFQPAERLASAGPGADAVRFELVPLRGGAGTWSGGGTAKAGEGPASPAAREAAPALADSVMAFLDSVPMLVLAADSAWLAAEHKDAKWDSLAAFHRALAGADGSPALEPGTWRSLTGRVRDLQVRECDQERPRKRPLGREACDYLARAGAVAELRAAALERKSPSRNTRVYLEGLAKAADTRVSSWAKGLLKGPSADSQP